MRNLGSHWTLDGAAKELHRRADTWEFYEDPTGRNGKRLYDEMLLHEKTCMVLSLCRFRMMMKGEHAFSIRRFKTLAIRQIDPSNGKTVPSDWSNLIAVAEAVYGHELPFALYRQTKDRDQNDIHNITIYYDETWDPMPTVDPLLAAHAILFTEHEEFKSRRSGQD